MKKTILAFSAVAVVGFGALIISSCESTPDHQEPAASAPQPTYTEPSSSSHSHEGSGTSVPTAPAGSGSHY